MDIMASVLGDRKSKVDIPSNARNMLCFTLSEKYSFLISDILKPFASLLETKKPTNIPKLETLRIIDNTGTILNISDISILNIQFIINIPKKLKRRIKDKDIDERINIFLLFVERYIHIKDRKSTPSIKNISIFLSYILQSFNTVCIKFIALMIS